MKLYNKISHLFNFRDKNKKYISLTTWLRKEMVCYICSMFTKPMKYSSKHTQKTCNA